MPIVKQAADALDRAFLHRPESFFLAVVAAQVILWTLVPALTYTSAPMDVMENIGWGREWQLGYHAHPPLQAWLTFGFVGAAGGAVWPAYLLSQLAIAVTYLPLYLLGRDAAGPRAGLLAVLAFTLCYYANLPTPEFNANVVQMPIWAFATLALWRASAHGRLRWWIGLGIAAAAAVYAKYSAVILFGALFVASVAVPTCRRAYRTPGPYVAIVIAAILVLPHLWWLRETDFLPIRFAEERAGTPEGMERVLRPVMFLVAQALYLLLPAIVLAVGGAAYRKTLPEDGVAFGGSHDIRLYVALMAAGPFALTVLFALGTGYGIRDAWGTPMPVWISLAAVLFLRPAYRIPRLGPMLLTWAVIFTAMPVGLGLFMGLAANRIATPPHAAWPSPALAAELSAIWRNETNGAPLRIVAGDKWAIGIMTTYAPEHPSVLTTGDIRKSPWITEEAIARDGVLVVWRGRPGDVSATPPVELAALGPTTASGVVSVPFGAPDGPAAQLGWAILPPAAASGSN